MLSELLTMFATQSDFFLGLTIEHLEISVIAIIMAIIIGLGLGITVSEYPRNKWILTVVNIIYTIPSIALFGFLIPVAGVGDTNAIIALTVYGLLPMVRNTYTGIKTINPEIIEAAKGMGSTDRQILFKIKLPLALPHIMSAIRNMTVMTIALAGIASFIGAGGLGVAIYRGITTNNITLVVAGSILISILAIGIDLILAGIEKVTAIGHSRRKIGNFFRNKKVIAVIIIIILALGSYEIYDNFGHDTIHLASKSFTEQYIMGYMLEELIEHDTNYKVDYSSGVSGGSPTIQRGMEKGEFDVYSEYTGVAWMVILKNPGLYNESMFNTLKSQYKDRYNETWLNTYGFSNSYAIAVPTSLAKKYNLKTISDLVPISNQLTFGAESDYFSRADGYDNLTKTYGLNFKDTMDLDVSLKYDAVKQGKIDVVEVYTTDGRLYNSNLTLLEDDKHFFPSYYCCPVIS
ncbi:MAG: ABC transporter permease/substrate-binding protein, partial [Methanobrevibacter wolinii]